MLVMAEKVQKQAALLLAEVDALTERLKSKAGGSYQYAEAKGDLENLRIAVEDLANLRRDHCEIVDSVVGPEANGKRFQHTYDAVCAIDDDALKAAPKDINKLASEVNAALRSLGRYVG